MVTGVRASLATAQTIKRNSDTVVDSITATDINAFPDKSVAEALQRVAGITVTRFEASTDTVHFSAEPSGVIVRGLQQVRSEFNGRDVFNANSGRGLSFADVPPELMAGVDVYKNLTPDIIEGGIAGTINLRTRLPFDQSGQLFAVSADALWGDLARKVTPDISAIYSNRWNTEYGDFGFLADIAYSTVATDSQTMQYTHITPYVGFTAPATATVPDYGRQTVYIPGSLGAHNTLYDRTRTGVALAGQWRSPDHKLLLTAQYNESDYEEVWHEHYVNPTMGYTPFHLAATYACTPTDPNCGANASEPYPAPGYGDFTFNSNGMFHSGTMVTGIGWWGNGNGPSAGSPNSSQFAQNSSGQQLVNACYNNADNGWGATPACTPPQRGEDVDVGTRYSDTRTNVGDGSINLKYDPTDDLHFNFDYQHVESTVKSYDMTVDMDSFANVQISQNGNKRPSINLLPPTNVNLDPGGLANASNYYVHDAMDHLEDDKGHEDALRADVEWDLHTTWFDAIKAGVRFADRDQHVNYATYNWANVANEWTSATTCANGQPINQSAYFNVTRGPSGCFPGYPKNLITEGSFPAGFYGGGALNPTVFPFINYSILQSHSAISKALGLPSIGVGAWDPLCSNAGSRSNEVPGTCYTPAEMEGVDEKTGAAYLMLKFGGGDAKVFGFRVSGNIGARYVHTQDLTSGGDEVAALTPQNTPCTISTPQPGSTTAIVQYSAGCYIFGGSTNTGVATGLPGQPQVAAFANGASVTSRVKNTNDYWLPSFNLKVDLTDTWILRFAASRAMSRPDIGLIRNYISVSPGVPNNGQPVFCTSGPQTSPCFNLSGGAPVVQNGIVTNVTGVTPVYTAQSFNPYLKPILADQFDITLENYFAHVGSFSVDLFYKHFENYITTGSFYAPVTNNGVTNTVYVTGPVNTTGADLHGAELAFQRFFDFLPGIWSGLGIQANFTYVSNTGLKNLGNANNTTANVTGGNVTTTLNPGTLEELSKYAYNLIGMYEKGPVSMRLAYNWRSDFLITSQDCCTYYPMWQKGNGYLDGSFHYRLTPHAELDFEVANLLNTETVIEQQVTDGRNGLKIPSQWSQRDRSFQLGVRFKW